MTIEKEPFRSYNVDAERTKPKRDIFSVQVNPKQREWLNTFKKDSKISSDSTALKFLATIGMNAINSTFGAPQIKYLASTDRVKLLQE